MKWNNDISDQYYSKKAGMPILASDEKDTKPKNYKTEIGSLPIDETFICQEDIVNLKLYVTDEFKI